MALTGNVRHRLSSFGKKLILQVEVEYMHTYSVGGHIDSELTSTWRDATVEDLAILTLTGTVK